jgi:hypothetical protein
MAILALCLRIASENTEDKVLNETLVQIRFSDVSHNYLSAPAKHSRANASDACSQKLAKVNALIRNCAFMKCGLD